MNYVRGRYQTRFSIFPIQCSLSKPPVSVLSDGMLHADHKSKNVITLSANASKLRVAHQGVQGAYSEAAAMKAFPGCETLPVEKFEDTIKAVIPIENSLGGSVHENYDLLLRHTLHIVGETHLFVDHCLLGLPGVRIHELKCVLSHPQALAQCEMSLNKLGAVKRSVDNTAGAAKTIASQRIKENGAIASARAAEVYGLHILAHKFQDKLENVTRFLILAREPDIYKCYAGHYKTSIVFTLHGGPGTLAEALSGFYFRGINLCKIESRPLRKHPTVVNRRERNTSKMYFDYFFYIDFQAYKEEPRAQSALEHLQSFTKYFRILGCYPMEEIFERVEVSMRPTLHCQNHVSL